MWNLGRRKKVERQLYSSRKEMADQVADLSYLNDRILHLWNIPDLHLLRQEILTTCAGIMGASHGVFRVHNPALAELEIASSLGMSHDYLDRFGRVPFGIASCGQTFTQDQPWIVEKIDKLPESDPERHAALLGGYRAAFHIRLSSRNNEPMAVLSLFFRLPHRLPVRQIRLIEAYVRQAACFLDNATLHKTLEASDRNKDTALATLAHELRTPISVIQNCAYQLSNSADGEPPLDETSELLLRQSRKMGRLVEDLFDVSRISTGKLRLRFETVDVVTLMNQAARAVRPLIEKKNHDLAVTPPVEPLLIGADPIRLEQILVNLLTNAARYTNPGGQIRLAAWQEGDQVAIHVRDTGVGLNRDQINAIFEPYFQSNPSPDQARDGQGLGLGLSLVKSLVELHGGSITASSGGPVRGTLFLVHLPIRIPALHALRN